MRIAVIGAGYVGLVTAVCLADRGHDVIVAETSAERRAVIDSGRAPFFEPLLDELLKKLLAYNKIATVAEVAQAVTKAQVTFIAVGTPFDGLAIDLSQVKAAAAAIGRALSGSDNYHVVAVKSTVVPGVTDTVVRGEIEAASGLTLGQFGLCMNPEFLREGSAVEDFREPDRIVIGSSDERAASLLASIYDGFECPFIHTSLRNAELTKYASNSLLSLLISFSNELAGICEAVPDTDIETVMNGLHLDKRLSPIVDGSRVTPQILSYLRAGCGFGGSCLPKDVNALRRFADTYGVDTPMLDATIATNEARPKRVVGMLESRLSGLNGRTIALLGLAFKPNTDDVRDSPSLKILDLLLRKGCRVQAFDPLVKSVAVVDHKEAVTFCKDTEQAFADADAVVLATSWPEFKNLNWSELGMKMRNKFVLDARRQLSADSLPPDMVYCPIGVRDSALPSAQPSERK